MSFVKSIAFGALAVLLAACSGGQGNLNTQANTLNELRQIVLANRTRAQSVDVVLTRALLDQQTVSRLETVADNHNLTAYLVPLSRRGPVTVWRDANGVQFVVREGLLTGTRGLGGDLVSSDYAPTLAAIKAGAGTYERAMYLRNALGGQDKLTMRCTMQSLGTVGLEVVERIYAVRHLQEACLAEGVAVTNEYWAETNTGLIRQSRQWGGPGVGFLSFRLLVSR